METHYQVMDLFFCLVAAVTNVTSGCMEDLLSSYSAPSNQQQHVVTSQQNSYNSFQPELTPQQMPDDHMNQFGEEHTQS